MFGSESPPAERPDLRLLPVVAPLWAVQAVVLLLGPGVARAAVVTGGAVLGAALGLGASALGRGSPGRWLRRTAGRSRGPGRSRSNQPRHARPRALAALVLAGAGIGAMASGLHLARLHPPLLDSIANGGMVVRASVRITGDPVRHEAASDNGRPSRPIWTASARLEHVVVRGHPAHLRAPVMLQGDAVAHMRYGATLEFAARARPAWAPESQAVTLRVLGAARERAPPGAVAATTNAIRAAFRAACAGLSPDAGALLLGLSVGDESTLPASLDTAMTRAGLAHLTAVSGSNTALVMAIALALVTAAGMGWRMRASASLLVLAGYVALVRPQPSVLRAAAMGVVALLALGVGGRRRGSAALLGACLALLVALPAFAISLGFALSVAATGGLLLVGPPMAGRLGRWRATRWAPEPVRAAFAVAAAAHLATLPLSVLMGNGASLVALPANVLVTPLVPVATVLGLVAALVAPLWQWPAVVLAHVASPATAAIARIAHSASSLPLGVLPVPDGPEPALLTAALLAVGATIAARGWRPWRDWRVLTVVALALALVLGHRTMRDAAWPVPDWLVLACDVGQGDGVLLRAPGASDALLVDVGPGGGRVGTCVRDAGVRRVVVLLTHFHADHIDGLADVLHSVEVDAILASPVPQPPQGAHAVLTEAAGAGVPVRTLRAGARQAVAGIALQVLWPARAIDESPANNASVVVLATVPGARPLHVLMTGDIEPEAQAAVMGRGGPPALDVVKVPHHGSRYQLPGFARWASARIALVCVGRGNDYGHPSAATLLQYRAAGSLVGRTDEQGALAVVLRGGAPALAVER
ncbi:MAG TPA: ComEC/Rec2 family competence protein [Candidatus Nanopelagicales bacterium]